MRTQVPRLRADFSGGGGGANPALGAVVWNPGAAPDPTGQYVTTWAEVMTSFAESSGAFYVYLDDAGGGPFTIPVGTYNLDSRLSFARPAPAVGQLTVAMADGAVLQDLAGVYRNITLQMNPTAAPAISMTNGRGIEFDLNARLENAGTFAGIEVAAGDTVFLGFYRASRATATGAVIADLGAGSTLDATFQTDSQASVNWVTGAALSTLAYRVDNTFSPVTLGAPPATVTTVHTTPYAPWATVLIAARGNCDPGQLMRGIQRASSSCVSPGQISPSVVRCCLFIPPADITINRMRGWGIAVTTNTFRAALYRYSDLARLTAELPFSTAVNAWFNIDCGAVALSRGVPYFLAVGSDSSAATVALQCCGSALSSGQGPILTAPDSLPGNMAASLGYLDDYCFQFATALGVLPNPANALIAQAVNWGGNMPAIWLDTLDA